MCAGGTAYPGSRYCILVHIAGEELQEEKQTEEEKAGMLPAFRFCTLLDLSKLMAEALAARTVLEEELTDARQTSEKNEAESVALSSAR